MTIGRAKTEVGRLVQCYSVIQNTDIESITVYYLLKGYTENDADMVHSVIERNKVSSMMVPNDWCALIRT